MQRTEATIPIAGAGEHGQAAGAEHAAAGFLRFLCLRKSSHSRLRGARARMTPTGAIGPLPGAVAAAGRAVFPHRQRVGHEYAARPHAAHLTGTPRSRQGIPRTREGGAIDQAAE